jgi:hypothetical protein
MPFKVFWTEPAGFVNLHLRRYTYSDGHKCVTNYGHDAETFAGKFETRYGDQKRQNGVRIFVTEHRGSQKSFPMTVVGLRNVKTVHANISLLMQTLGKCNSMKCIKTRQRAWSIH